jgi:type II restriction enzyme
MQSKRALDSVIKKSRVHFYKPIQIAEILFHNRPSALKLSDLEAYRNSSKRWRDQVTQRLIGRISTSSQKFQDNLFEANAMPPHLLSELEEFNRAHNGLVEAYIYRSLQNKLNTVYEVEKYIKSAAPETFDLKQLLHFFVSRPGLKRSIDKMYEITVYALFATIVRALQAQVTVEINNKDEEVLKDFETFIKTVLGLDLGMQKISRPASLFRVGVTNAADRGLDMLTNFGPVIQVKHLTLTPELVEDIATGIAADSIIIVCLEVEKAGILALIAQLGLEARIQGIITLSDLEKWYETCMSGKYRATLGNTLLVDLTREFDLEFPSSIEIEPFMSERGYDKISLPADWSIINI